MSRRSAGPSFALAVAVLLGPSADRPPLLAADLPPEVQRSVDRGIAFLRTNLPKETGGRRTLMALAILKATSDPDDADVRKVVGEVGARLKKGYNPTHHLYEAGLDMMLLEASDREKHRASLQTVLDYVLASQKEYGAWYYPGQTGVFGDTSITQYALLGLWSAERAGLDVPQPAWARLVGWQLRTQQADGGFSYHPDPNRPDKSTRTMSPAGACNLLLARLHLYGDAAGTTGEAEPEDTPQGRARKKYGAFEAVDPEEDRAEKRPDVAVASAAQIDKSVARAVGRTAALLKYGGGPWDCYHLYTIERLAALGDLRTIGPHDWYGEGVRYLLANQKADGHWEGDTSTHDSTSFAILFLTRSTAKALGRAETMYGTGLLKGGRGLPDDLTKVSFRDGELKVPEPDGPLSDLLSQLDDGAAADVPGLQDEVLEKVRTGDREALLGQVGRLRRLVTDPRADVRRVSLWALARSGDLTDAAAMLERLVDDPDPGVALEAHNALCVLFRLPFGPDLPAAWRDRLAGRSPRPRKLPVAPLAGVPGDADANTRDDAAAQWRGAAVAAWTEYFEQLRPYAQRDLPSAPRPR